MPVETPSLFAQVIEDHLRLKARNSDLEDTLPLHRYKSEDPFHNHPLFKTERQARIEEIRGGETSLVAEAGPAWPGEDTGEIPVTEPDDSLWGRSRDFDWGD